MTQPVFQNVRLQLRSRLRHRQEPLAERKQFVFVHLLQLDRKPAHPVRVVCDRPAVVPSLDPHMPFFVVTAGQFPDLPAHLRLIDRGAARFLQQPLPLPDQVVVPLAHRLLRHEKERQQRIEFREIKHQRRNVPRRRQVDPHCAFLPEQLRRINVVRAKLPVLHVDPLIRGTPLHIQVQPLEFPFQRRTLLRFLKLLPKTVQPDRHP